MDSRFRRNDKGEHEPDASDTYCLTTLASLPSGFWRRYTGDSITERKNRMHKKGRAAMRPYFVFIKCELGKAYEVSDMIVEQIEETSEVHSVSGEYDLLAKFFLEDEDDIGRFVCDRVQKIPHIRDTHTLIVFKAYTC